MSIRLNILELDRDELERLVRTAQVPIAVYGLGYVGLSVAAVWLRAGAKVVGVDVDESKVEAANRGSIGSWEREVVDALKRGLIESKFRATSDGISASAECPVKIVTVPVYLAGDSPDYAALEEVSRVIGRGLEAGDLVVIESSAPPGTTEEIVLPVLEEESGLACEREFGLAYSPERVYIGRAVRDIEERYPKIVAGVGPRSARAAENLYSIVARKGTIVLPGPVYAELEKLLEGVYRYVNIALANELAELCAMLGIDYELVAKAANSQPYCHLHKPGPGVGGFCIPVYSRFVAHVAGRLGVELGLLERAREVNDEMPERVVELVVRTAREAEIGEPRVAILGLAFRGGVGDTRLSPSYQIVRKLLERGLSVLAVHDPYVESDEVLEDLGVRLAKDLGEALRGANVVVIATDHPQYEALELEHLKKASSSEIMVVVDSRRIVANWRNPPPGVYYVGIGRPLVRPGKR